MGQKAMDKARITSFETDRLVLRLMPPDEWQEFVDHVIEADECYYTFASKKSDELLKKIRKPWYAKVIYYTIHLLGTDQMIGYVGYSTGTGDIEYFIFKDYRRLGYAYEAVATLIDQLINGSILGRPVHEIRAWTVWDNIPSTQLLLKLGFRVTGFRLCYDNSIGRNFSYTIETKEDAA